MPVGWLIAMIVLLCIATLLFTAAARVAIQEYFRQKRMFLLETLQYGVTEDHSKGEVTNG